MFNRKLFAWVAALLMIPGIALAEASWDIVAGSGDGLCSFTGGTTGRGGYSICYAEFDADENSAVIDTSICENWSLHFISDIDDTTYDTTINARWSISATASANTSEIVDNKTLTGDPATGLDVLAGYDSPWLYIDVASYSAGDTAQVALQCFKRRW